MRQNIVVAEAAKSEFSNLSSLFLSLHDVANCGGLLPEKSDAPPRDLENSLSVENVLRIIGPETSTLLYNLASLYFHKHRYESCRQILEALYVHIESIGVGLSLKVSFLLLEVMLRMWLVVGITNLEANLPNLENQTSTILKFIEKYCLDLDSVTEIKPSETNKEKNVIDETAKSQEEDSTDDINLQQTIDNKLKKSIIMKKYVSFKVHLYRCRVLLLLNQIQQAKKEIQSALHLYHNSLLPSLQLENANVSVTSEAKNELSPLTSLAIGAGGPSPSLDELRVQVAYIQVTGLKRIYIILFYAIKYCNNNNIYNI